MKMFFSSLYVYFHFLINAYVANVMEIIMRRVTIYITKEYYVYLKIKECSTLVLKRLIKS